MLPTFAVFTVLAFHGCLGSNNVYHLNERDFEGYIRDKDIMLVDFFAPWCSHCQELSPELDAAADQLATKNQFAFAKVDCVNDGKQLCQRFNIQGYPTIKLFKYGQYVGDYVGQRDRNSLMQYVDSVASTFKQNAPLTSGMPNPVPLAQPANYKPQAQVFPSHHGPATAPAPAIAPTFMNHANMHMHAHNPSLMHSFYGSSAHAQHPANMAAYLGSSSLTQSSPDSLQSKFGNLASLDVYRAKLKMIAAYKNYQRRLKEYRQKLTVMGKANVHPSTQGFAGAVTRPPRPGVNAFAQPQSYRGYYRPEALAAQNVQINRAYPQARYGAYNTGYPSQYASPYGYQAVAGSPYYRSKTFHGGKRRHGKQRRPRPAAVRKPTYNTQPGATQVNNRGAYYYKQQQQQQRRQQQQFRQQPQQQEYQKVSQQQFRQQKQERFQHATQQFRQPPQQQQQQQFQQESRKEQTNYKQQQDNNRPQISQAVDKPALPIPEQSSDSQVKPDSSTLKDLKADIESAIQDALKNAVSKGSEKTKPSPSVHVDGERAKPQATAAAPEPTASGSGAQSPTDAAHGSGIIGDALTGEATGSGSGAKPDTP